MTDQEKALMWQEIAGVLKIVQRQTAMAQGQNANLKGIVKAIKHRFKVNYNILTSDNDTTATKNAIIEMQILLRKSYTLSKLKFDALMQISKTTDI